ncbi:MAG: cytochrome b [Betaproteobacteria bacterium]|nr:cytochrome b [Betaproteobacteria bacterium]
MSSTPVAEVARYTLPAQLLHWLIALLIFGLFPLGLYMHGLPLSVRKIELYSWHKWFGITVLLLVVLRIGWRLTHRPPPLPGDIPPWQQATATLMHELLYLLMLCIPLSGWALSSAAGVPVVWWGVWKLPNLLPANPAMAHLLELVHATLNYTLAALVAVHMAAALKHQFIDHDGVLLRMLPRLLPRSLPRPRH